MKTALDYSQQALKIAPTQSHLQFNVAFVQFQIAELIRNLKETQKTVDNHNHVGSGGNDMWCMYIGD